MCKGGGLQLRIIFNYFSWAHVEILEFFISVSFSQTLSIYFSLFQLTIIITGWAGPNPPVIHCDKRLLVPRYLKAMSKALDIILCIFGGVLQLQKMREKSRVNSKLVPQFQVKALHSIIGSNSASMYRESASQAGHLWCPCMPEEWHLCPGVATNLSAWLAS